MLTGYLIEDIEDENSCCVWPSLGGEKAWFEKGYIDIKHQQKPGILNLIKEPTKTIILADGLFYENMHQCTEK